MEASIRLRREHLVEIRERVALITDAALARHMGADPGNLSRVLAGKQQPGPRFIAALCICLEADFDDLFLVVPPVGPMDREPPATVGAALTQGSPARPDDDPASP